MSGSSSTASVVVAMLLMAAALPSYASNGTNASQEDESPLGLRLTEELHAIIREHVEAVRSAILEFRITRENITEAKKRLVEDFVEERLNRTRAVREALSELMALYMAGNITREEYLARLSELRSELRALEKTIERLGHLLQKFSRELREAVMEKVERLRQAGAELGSRVSEEARALRYRAAEIRGEGGGSNSTARGGGEGAHPAGGQQAGSHGKAAQHRPSNSTEHGGGRHR